MPTRQSGCAVYESTSTPIPIQQYKSSATPALSSYIDQLTGTAEAIKNKAKAMAGVALDKLNVKGIRNVIDKVTTARAEIMSAVSGAVSWVADTVKSVTDAVDSVVGTAASLVSDLSNMIKQNEMYKSLNALCTGADLSDLAEQIASIKAKINFSEALDYALSQFDTDMLDTIQNCQLFDKDSLTKVKDAAKGIFGSGNYVTLNSMKQSVDFFDMANFDRGLKAGLKYSTANDGTTSALQEILEWMGLSADFLFILNNDNRFTEAKVYDIEDVVDSASGDDRAYIDETVGSVNVDMMIAANALLV